MEELRSLEGVNEAVRGAAFLCRFASAEQKHPVGIVTNLPSLHGDLYLGWPQLHSTGDQLACQGPLPRDCPRTLAHSPMTRIPGVRSCLLCRLFFLQVFGHASFVPSGKPQTQFPLGIGVWS